MKHIFLFIVILLTLTIWIHTEAEAAPPTVTLAEVDSGNKTGDFNVTITFSEAVRNFSSSDIEFDPAVASVASLTDTDDTVYTARIIPKASGSLTIKVGAGVATNSANEGNAAASDLTVTIELPMAIMVMEPENDVNNEAFNVVVMFTEAVEEFVIDDITLEPSGLATVTEITGSAPTYTVEITPEDDVEGTLTISVEAGDVVNDSTPPTDYPASNEVETEIDTLAPSADTVTKVRLPSGTLTNAPFDVTVTFNEDVTYEMSVNGNATVSPERGDADAGEDVVFTVTPDDGIKERVALYFDVDDLTDAAGNTNPSIVVASFPLSVDTIPPTVRISGEPDADDPQNTAFDLTVKFSEPVSGLSVPADLEITGTGFDVSVPSSQNGSSTYTLTIEPDDDVESDITIRVRAGAAQDNGGNDNEASDVTGTIRIDTRAPTVDITSVPMTAQNGPFDLTVTFSEPVNGFSVPADLTTTGTGFDATLQSGRDGDAEYMVRITPQDDMENDVTIQVDAGAAQDAAGNDNTASTVTDTFRVDTRAPTVEITDVPTTPQNGPFEVTVRFNEDVTGFAHGDITVNGPAMARITDDSNAPEYEVTITPNNRAEGDVTIQIPAGAVEDTAGNNNTASDVSTAVPVDTLVPTAMITGEPTTEQNSAFDITVTFNEDVTGFDVPADLTIRGTNHTDGGVTARLKPGETQGPRVYIVEIEPQANREDTSVTVKVNADAAEDAAGNGNTASAVSDSFGIDTIAPDPAFSGAPGSDWVENKGWNIDILFGEAVTGFTVGDITVTGPVDKSLANGIDASEYTLSLDVRPDSEGAVTVQIPAGVATDLAGNSNLASRQVTFSVDSAPPTLTSITGVPTGPQSAPFDVTFTFSEGVNHFIRVLGNSGGLELTGPLTATSVTGANGGSEYTVTFTPTPGVATGTATFKVKADHVQDLATNPYGGSSAHSIAIDTVAPTVMLEDVPTTEQNAPFDIKVTFDEAVFNFAASDITVTGPATAAIKDRSNAPEYIVTITPNATSEGNVTIQVPAGGAQDAAGNDNVASAVSAVHVDTAPPTVTFEDVPTTEQNAPFDVTVRYSEPVTGGFGVHGPADGTSTAINTTTNRVRITPRANMEGDVTIRFDAGALTDAAGNVSTAVFTSNIVHVDTIVPMATITDVPTTEQNGPFDITVNFIGGGVHETVLNFAATDVTVTGPATAAIKDSPGDGEYIVTITPNAGSEGNVTLQIPAGAAQDAAGNNNTASLVSTVHVDTIAPTVTITGLPSSEQNLPFLITVGFGEDVMNFAESDLSVTGPATAEFAFIFTPDKYTVEIIPNPTLVEGDVTLQIPAGAAQDAAGNDNVASANVKVGHLDTIAPMATITDVPTTPQNGPFDITVNFIGGGVHETVVDFTDSDVTVTGPATAAITDSPGDGEYIVAITPNAGSEGNVTLQIPAGAAQDAAGNNNTASAVSNAVRVDTVVPTVSFGVPSDEKNAPFDLTVTFSENVTGFMVPDDLTITGPATAALKSGTQGPSIYTLVITPNTASEGDVTIQVVANAVQDVAGNNNALSPVSTAVHVDTIQPTVAISGEPSTTENVTERKDPFPITITFDEPVTGFAADDLTIVGPATATSVVGADGDAVYRVTITPNVDVEDATVTVTVNADAVDDSAGNKNTASPASTPVHVDTKRPTVAISGEPATTENETEVKDPFDITITFSEDVTGFAVPADLTIVGPATAALAGGTQGPAVYRVTITPNADVEDVTVTVTVNADAVDDNAGNKNEVSPASTPVHLDTKIPTVAISGEPPTVADETEVKDPFDITITFSEKVTGFAVPADLTIVGPATAALASGADGDAVYRVTITPNVDVEDVTVTVTVNATSVQDYALNDNVVSPASTPVHVDTKRPTVAISGVPLTVADETEVKDPFDLTITFSEKVTGFAVPADLTIVGPATAALASGADGDAVYRVTITPNLGVEDVTVSFAIPEAIVQDYAQNENIFSQLTDDVHLDTVVPTVAISAVHPTTQHVDEVNTDFPITVTFSERVTGFAPDDLTITGAATATSVAGADGEMEYTVTITPDPGVEEGEVTVTVNAGGVKDYAENFNTASVPSAPVYIDTVAPRVSFENVPTLERRNAPFDITVIFHEPVREFGADDLILNGPVTASLASGSPLDLVYTLTITPNPNSRGDLTFQVAALGAVDVAGNRNALSIETNTVRIDTVPPAPEITGLPTGVQNAPFDITIDFQEPVNGFTTEDILVTGPATATLKVGVDGDVEYTVTIIPNANANGNVTLQIPAGVVTDFATNANTASAISAPIAINSSALIAQITDVPQDVQLGAFSVTITFTEAVVGFELADIAITGDAVVASTELSGRGSSYMLKITPNENTDGNVIIQVPAGVATDNAANSNAASVAQTVAVAPSWMPDADIRAAVRASLNLPEGADFDQDVLARVTTLQTEPGEITNLTGLELATALTTLDLSDSMISNVSPLTGLTALTTLNLGDNTITDLTPLDGLTALTTLTLEGNSITDVSPLVSLTALTTLTLEGNSITDVSPLTGLTALTTLNLGGNAITDITPLAGLTQLTTLDLSGTSVTNWATLATLTTLTTLDLSSNNISDLNIIANLTGLVTLNLSDNIITDITPLAGLTALTTLNLSNNTVSILAPLASLTSLTTLNLNSNAVSNLDVLGGLANLTTLQLAGNTISDLRSIADMFSLTVLDLRDNSISEVDVLARLINLTMLGLAGNPILDTSPLYPLTQRTPPVEIDVAVVQFAPWDVNADGSVNALDSALVTAALGQIGEGIVNPRTDVNGDGVVDNADLLLVTDNFDVNVPGAPALANILALMDSGALKSLDRVRLQAALDQLLLESDGSLKYGRAIALLQTLLAAMAQPEQTRLLANYPNPFNPETWIPYQLATGSDVQLTIYDVKGIVVRHLQLGHQAAGYYTEKQSAAYWDGRNAVGERVASGVYFYQLQADNVSLLRKMVILK